MDNKTIDTAVIPVAGLGTRMAPYTAGSPKFMAPILAGTEAKPNIDYTLDDILDAGIKNVIFITSNSGDKVLQDYLGPIDADIIERYKSLGKLKDLEKELQRRQQYADMNIVYLDQPVGPYGTAVPLSIAKEALQGVRHFAITGGDDFVWHADPEAPSELRRQITNWQQSGADASIMGKPVPREEGTKYGILQVGENNCLQVIDEKPPMERVPEDPKANISRYILNSDIWPYVDALIEEKRDLSQPEYYITDVINNAVRDGMSFDVHAVEGMYFDAGSPAGVRHASDTITLMAEAQSLHKSLVV